MEQIFDKIPKSSVEYVRCLISSENIIFKLKKSRRTKHGDFSIKKNGLVIITINEDLNAYRFLITLIHEISHYFSVKNHGVCLLYTSPSPRDISGSRMPSSA